jgi:hypothetical protein
MTLVMLFFVSLLPFATSLMATHLVGQGSRLSVFIYGLDLLLVSVMLDRIMRYLARRPELLVTGLAEEELRAIEHQRQYGIMLDGIGVLLALILPRGAIAIYVSVAIYFILQPLFFGRRLKPYRERKEGGESRDGRWRKGIPCMPSPGERDSRQPLSGPCRLCPCRRLPHKAGYFSPARIAQPGLACANDCLDR